MLKEFQGKRLKQSQLFFPSTRNSNAASACSVACSTTVACAPQVSTGAKKFRGLIVFDSPSASFGDCQFSAAADQLRRIFSSDVTDVSHFTAANCRQAAVEWLMKNKNNCQQFVTCIHGNETNDHCDMCWNTYLSSMRLSSTFGDNLTLLAMSHVYGIQWIVISTRDDEHCIVSDSDRYNPTLPTAVLGFDVEAKHYVSLSKSSDMTLIYSSVRGMKPFTTAAGATSTLECTDSCISSKSVPLCHTQKDSCEEAHVDASDSSEQVTMSGLVCHETLDSLNSDSVTQCGTDSNNPDRKTKNMSANEHCGEVKKKTSGRQFQPKWMKVFPWIAFDNQKRNVTCSVCSDVVNSGAKVVVVNSASSRESETVNAFVRNGFSSWNKALERFRAHEKSDLHRACIEMKLNISQNRNVHGLLSASKQKEMRDARAALLSILSSLRYLVSCGLPIRGHTDDTSNLLRLLRLRSDDVVELKSWLGRNSYKWISHDIINEMLSLMSHALLRKMALSVQDAKLYSLIVDETCDASVHEQISICIRYVDSKLNVQELFFGFYETSMTSAEAVHGLIMDALARFNFDITNCRGQCYDGAANMGGTTSGVQARIRMQEHRALYVHCCAHSVNLVVQDSVKQLGEVRDFLNNMKELINFVRASPKRLAQFTALQADDKDTVTLRPFCPTRWCLRVASLRTVQKDYDTLLLIMEDLNNSDKTDCGAKAFGFLNSLQDFKAVFYLHLVIFVFQRVEILNAALQRSTLSFTEARNKIDLCCQSLINKRDCGFDELWEESLTFARDRNIEAELPRRRKVPRRYDTGSQQTEFQTPQDMYRAIYFKVADTAIRSLNDRFDTSTSAHLVELENFAVGKSDGHYVCDFYANDLDRERLVLHRDMFLDIAKGRGVNVTNVKVCVDFFTSQECSSMLDMLTEFVKFIKIILTIPVSSCCAERSFSALRRIKTYLRTTLTQEHLNSAAILHVHQQECQALNLDSIANEFINRATVRHNTFAQ